MLAYSLIDEEIQEMKDGSNNKDREEIKDGLSDTIFCLGNACYFEGIKLEDLADKFNKVVKSNYSKFPLTREEAVLSTEAYIKGEHFTKKGQLIPAKYESTGNSQYPFVIKHAVSGKLLKSINYLDPDKF